MDKMTFQEAMREKTASIEEILKKYLPEETGYQKTVIEAMNYSLLAGGKRLRPMLMQECYRLFGGKDAAVEPFMAAMEMLHTYSLVHDDLPAMDNDEYRRGRKTTWVVYGDAMGVLAGDGLLNLAFETAIGSFRDTVSAEDMRRRAAALQIFGRKAGIYGMIGGQTADVENDKTEGILTEDKLLFIHKLKTGALIQSAMMVGAALAGADENALSTLEQCGECVGVAFQIKDDILDVVGTAEELGKPIGSDAQNNKQTYVTINGLEKSQKDVESISARALELLDSLPGDKEFLRALIESLICRTK